MTTFLKTCKAATISPAPAALKILLALLTLLALTACQGPHINDYRGTEPELDLFAFFTGELSASGVVRKRSGKVIRHFNASITANQQGDVLTLDEQFVFSDGEQQQRIWRIQREKDNNFRGRAADVDGEARGQSRGQALQWRYKLELSVDGKQYKVKFDDWMYLVNSHTLINISDMYFWGFKVGDVVLVINKDKKQH
ncbi:DUF3833 domain-containing protein [Agaribacterium haliotis]|uniref:DUF3833 domain-containing protein n=1 Tax=Agaribacterium haliotis TaxID=2013869 RepID=UPI000BB58DF0|nr:DUF3833 domain-containing protein [Agaribacterium haliotis]